MGKTYHSKREYKKLVEELGISAAKAAASRHPSGTRAKGLRKISQDKRQITDDRNRFGDAYEKSSRMRRIRRYIKHAARNAAKTVIRNKNFCNAVDDICEKSSTAMEPAVALVADCLAADVTQ